MAYIAHTETGRLNTLTGHRVSVESRNADFTGPLVMQSPGKFRLTLYDDTHLIAGYLRFTADEVRSITEYDNGTTRIILKGG